jgi:hypothetical protein
MSVSRNIPVFLLLGTAAGCGGSGGPAGPGGNNTTGDGMAQVVLTIAGQVGTERDMTVRYVIADGPTTRAAASAMLPVPFGCFSDINPVCPIDVPVGKRITFFAIEGEGVVAGDAGNGRPVPPPDPLRHEFVSYVGDCETGATLGDCVMHVTADRQYNIRAEFAQMKSVVFQLKGAGALAYSFTVRDRLAFPNRPYENTNPGCCAGAGVYIPAAPLVYAYLPTGSTVTATRHVVGAGLSAFVQWDRACTTGGGVEGSCTLIVGPTPTPTAMAMFEWYDCGNQGLTDGGTGPNPPQGCTKMRP